MSEQIFRPLQMNLVGLELGEHGETENVKASQSKNTHLFLRLSSAKNKFRKSVRL